MILIIEYTLSIDYWLWIIYLNFWYIVNRSNWTFSSVFNNLWCWFVECLHRYNFWRRIKLFCWRTWLNYQIVCGSYYTTAIEWVNASVDWCNWYRFYWSLHCQWILAYCRCWGLNLVIVHGLRITSISVYIIITLPWSKWWIRYILCWSCLVQNWGRWLDSWWSQFCTLTSRHWLILINLAWTILKFKITVRTIERSSRINCGRNLNPLFRSILLY